MEENSPNILINVFVVHVNFYVAVIKVSDNKRGNITFVPNFVHQYDLPDV